MDAVIGRWPVRAKELWELYRLLGLEHQAVDNEEICMSGPPLALCPVVVHGPFSSHGKELVADLLNSVQPDCPKAVVCCASQCSLREFLNNMLGQATKLQNQHLSSSGPSSFASPNPKCDSWADFVRQIRIRLSGEKEGKGMSGEKYVKFFVVLDRSELLGRGWPGNHEPGEELQRFLALFNSGVVSPVQLVPIFITQSATVASHWRTTRAVSLAAPFNRIGQLLFRRAQDGVLWLAPLPGIGWDKSQSIIAKKGFINKQSSYLSAKVVQSVGIATHDLEEISRIIVALWPVYLECFKLSLLSSDEAREMPTDELLQAHIAPYLEHAFNNLYQAKFIFLAAYLCRENPPDSDERMFTHRRTGKKKKTKGSGGGLEIDSETRINSDFDLERILSVLSALLSSPCAESHTGWKSSERANLAVNSVRFGQLERFSESRLIVRVSGPDRISNPRYRCFIDKRLAETIACELGLPLSEYLA